MSIISYTSKNNVTLFNQSADTVTSTNTIQSICIDKEGLESLFNDQYSRLCAYAFNFLKEDEASEEVVQDVFFKLWVNRTTIQIDSSLESYMFRSVRNACLSLIKHIGIRENYKLHNQEEISYEENRDIDYSAVTELEKKIRDSIDALPEQRRKIFILSRYEHLKYKEIAERLNISVKTVENQMGKALKFLREELEDYLPLILLFLGQFFLQLTVLA
ncbi:RNA polymerase sigma-70 factor [Puteibacter caeruleilacunae]|nr:RNA polymerase sigma-70 factor [Puteibacter caeruleilacunae]